MPGEPVTGSGAPMSAVLGPGIISNIFDGIERPLRRLEQLTGAFIDDGAEVSSLDTEKKYSCTVKVRAGDRLEPGQIYCTCQETPVIEHRCMLSPLSKGGEVIWCAGSGEYTVNDTVVKIKNIYGGTEDLTLCQKWPIRTPPSLRGKTADKPSADYWPENSRYDPSYSEGWNGGDTRRLRNGKDNDSASAGEMVRR